MTHPNKVKGNNYEREVRNQAAERGIDAKRAYASDGRALGHCEGVDLDIAGTRIQAKKRKKLLAGIKKDFLPGEGVDAVVFRENRGISHITMRLDYWLDLLEWMIANGWNKSETSASPQDTQ